MAAFAVAPASSPGGWGPAAPAAPAAPARAAAGRLGASRWDTPLGALLGFAAVRLGSKVLRRAKRSDLLRLGGASVFLPQVALAKSKQEAVEELKSYAMAEIVPTEEAPGGWSWVVEGVGLTKDAFMINQKFMMGDPTIVRFLCPPFWKLEQPRVDYNGASGTVQINNYVKGDTATIFVDTEFKGNLAEMKKADFIKSLSRGLTLKGTASLEGLRVEKISDLEGAPNYKLVEFDWTLYTGAGFELDRNGFACLTQLTPGGPLTILWGGVVSTRWLEMKDTMLQVIKSFRAAKVPEGIKIEMRKEYKDFNTDFREER